MKRPLSPLLKPIRDSFILGAVLFVLVGAVASCRRTESAATDPAVAARVGDEVILVKEVEAEIAWRIARGAMVPSREALLEDMIERRLLVQKAMAAGLDKTPDVKRGWENLLIGRYRETHVGKESREVTVTDDEINQRYEAKSERFTRHAKARLAILTTALPVSLEPDQREKKIAAMREARASALHSPEAPGFGSLAVRYSEDDVTRHRGGDAGWLDEGVAYRWPASVVKAGFALPVNGISEPVTEGNAVFLVKKLDQRPPAKMAIDQVRVQLRREIHAEKLRSVESSFAKNLREGIAIERFPESLAGIKIPSAAAHTASADEQPPNIP